MNHSNETILIVEDELLIALELKVVLSNEGYKILGVVNSGEKAIAAAEQQEPNFILMDINLKGKLNGVETAEKIVTKVIFLSAYNPKDYSYSPVVKSSMFLTKPFSPKQVVNALERIH